MLSAKALSYLRKGQDSLDNERLYIGLNSKNTEIKLLCIDKLKERNLLSVGLIEGVIESDDYKLRLRALEYLSNANRTFYRDRAKSVLIIKNGSSNNEEYYDQYISSCQVYEKYDSLVKENDKFSLSAIPLVSLARLNKKKYLPLIREILSNGCSDYYDKRLLSILPEGKAKDDFFSGSAKEFVTSRMTSELLTWLSSCMYKEDLMMIRSIVSNGNIYISSEVLDYFYKNGEWIDISLLSDANLQKRSASLLSFIDNNSAYARVANVALKIGKGREGELIDLNLNKKIISIIISRLPVKSFKNLNDDKIVGLLNDYSPEIRERAALKSIDCLNKSRIKLLLKKLQLGDSYYYNSVHWLDMGISVKHDLIGRAVKPI